MKNLIILMINWVELILAPLLVIPIILILALKRGKFIDSYIKGNNTWIKGWE